MVAYQTESKRFDERIKRKPQKVSNTADLGVVQCSALISIICYAVPSVCYEACCPAQAECNRELRPDSMAVQPAMCRERDSTLRNSDTS